MTLPHDFAFPEPESFSTIAHHDSSTISTSSHHHHHHGHEESPMTSPPPAPSPSPPFQASSLPTKASSKKRSNHAVSSEKVMMKRLYKQLSALRSLVPPSARSPQSSVIADALRYKEALQKKLEQLERALPYAEQVIVVRRERGLQIKVSCKKKAGLLIALMEAMESFGLVFSEVNVCCDEGIAIDAISAQCSTQCIDGHSLRLALMAIIARFSE